MGKLSGMWIPSQWSCLKQRICLQSWEAFLVSAKWLNSRAGGGGRGCEGRVSLLTRWGISTGGFLGTWGFPHRWNGAFKDPQPADTEVTKTQDTKHRNQNDHSHACSSQSRVTLLLLIFFTCPLLQPKPTLGDHHWPGNTAFLKKTTPPPRFHDWNIRDSFPDSLSAGGWPAHSHVQNMSVPQASQRFPELATGWRWLSKLGVRGPPSLLKGKTPSRTERLGYSSRVSTLRGQKSSC